MIFDESVGLSYAPNEEQKDELLTCYDCDSEFKKSELEKYEGLTLCPECLRNYKQELMKDYNENE